LRQLAYRNTSPRRASLEEGLDKLRFHGHDFGAWARKLLDTDSSAVAHRALVEVTLPGERTGAFEVDVHNKIAEDILRPIVIAAALGGAQPITGWSVILDSALAGLVAGSAVLPAATGNRELRDALLRTAAKVFGLGAVGEIDVAGVTSVIAIANELRRWSTSPVQLVDPAALDAFLQGPAPLAHPDEGASPSPPATQDQLGE
jgi:hypothetical protein